MSDPTPSTTGAPTGPAAPPAADHPVAPRASTAPTPARRLLRELALAAGVAALAVLPVALWLTRLPSLAGRDSARLYQPIRGLVVEALRDWRLPLWNPYEGTGKPLLAEGLHGVLHPISVLMAWVDPAGIDGLLLAYLFAAAAGACLLARALGASAAAAALATFAYALSGFVTSMTGNLVFLAGAASLPWLVLAAQACARPGPWPALGTAIAAAAALLAGDAQVALIGVILGGALALRGGGWQALPWLAVGLALGALLAGVQLGPSLAHLQRTARHLGLTEDELVQWAFSPWRLLELASPGLFGAQDGILESTVFTGLATSPPYTLPFADSTFLGLPVLLLALRGARRGRAGPVLAVAGAALLWLALGHQAGATQALGWLPVWGDFRYAEKLLGPLSLVLALLAAGGLDATLVTARPVGRRLGMAIAGGLLAWAGLVAWGSPVVALLSAVGHAAVASEAQQRLLEGLPVLLGGVAGLGVALLAPLRPAVRGGLAAAGVLAGSAAALPYAIHPGPTTCLGPAWLARLQADQPGPRIAVPNYHEEDPRRPGGWTRSWCDLATMGVASQNVAVRVDQVDTYTGLDTVRFLKVFMTLGEDRWHAYRRFGLTHLVLHPALDEAEARTLARAAEGGRGLQAPSGGRWSVVEVPHRAWASFAPAVSAAPDAEGTLDRLRALLGAGLEEVVVQAERPPPGTVGRVLTVRRGTESVEVVAEAAGSGLLVVNDAFWPGWEARIDGAPATVLAADVLVRGVPFPAGRHTLTMRYAPPELRWGQAASAAGLVVWLALAALAWGRSRR